MNRCSSLFSFVLCILLLSSCSKDNDQPTPLLQWKKLGLDGKTVNQLQLSEEKLYVATTSGLFAREIGSTVVGFLSLGFANKNVQAVEIIGDGELIASIFDKSGAEPPALYHTTDDGETWNLMNTNFGDGSPEPVLDFAVHPTNADVLYATGYAVVAKSQDKGETWTPVYGSWGGLATGISVVTINPHQHTEIWAGGQGAIENGYLLRSVNETDWDNWNDLVSNPTVVKRIVFSDTNNDELYVGFEGALLKTTNGGDTWQTLIHSDEHKFFFGVNLSPENNQRVYTGGWVKTPDPQRLILHVSNDGGTTWNEFYFPDEPFGGIWAMTLVKEGDKDKLFLGLDKGGVYEVVVSR